MTKVTITPQFQRYIPPDIKNDITLQKSKILKIVGKYKNIEPTKKIDIDNIRDKIDYTKA